MFHTPLARGAAFSAALKIPTGFGIVRLGLPPIVMTLALNGILQTCGTGL